MADGSVSIGHFVISCSRIKPLDAAAPDAALSLGAAVRPRFFRDPFRR
jgi:hypothetical protein